MPAPSAEALVKRHDAAVKAGVSAQASGRFGLALDLFEESLELAEALGEKRKIHAARINVSYCYLSLGELASARNGLAEVVLESDNPSHVSAAAARLAEVLMKEGRLEKARRYLRTAVDSARRAEDRRREASALVLDGHLGVLESRHAEAVEAYATALAMHESLALPAEEMAQPLATLLDNLGYAQLLAGKVAEGLWTLRRGLNLSRTCGNRRIEAEAEKDLAFGFLLASKNPASERHALRALRIASENAYPSVIRNATFVLMELSLRTNRGEDFERYFTRLQEQMPDVKLSRDFFRIFDISDVINLKEF